MRLNPAESSSVSAIDYWNEQDAHRVVIEWTLGNTCNYSCSYCPSRLHDGSVAWVPKEQVLRTCRQLIAHYRDREITFLFTGGEPTVNKEFIEICAFLRENLCTIAVLTNGSRSLSWWSRAREHLDLVVLSFHPETACEAHFADVLKILQGHVALQVNVLLIPGQVQELADLAKRLSLACQDAAVICKPLVNNWAHVVNYAPEEREVVGLTFGANRSDIDFALKGDLCEVMETGDRRRRPPEVLLAQGSNRWLNWKCGIGVENLLIRYWDIWRGNCKVGGLIGRVGDAELDLPGDSISCTRQSCICLGDIKTRKWR